jgi:hypothetical protein
MILLPISSKGTLRLPKEALAQLGHSAFVEVRLGPNYLTLRPVRLQRPADWANIPEPKPKSGPV